MGSEEDPRDYDAAQKQFRVGFILAATSGTFMWLLMFFWVFHYNGGLAWASIMFRLFPAKPKIQVKLIHAGIHASTVFAMSIGLWAALRHHEINSSPHFYSIHSWIGLTAIVLYYGQFLAGFTVFLLPWAPLRIRSMVVPYHQMLGPLIFISSVVAAATGIMMKALGALGKRYSDLPSDALALNFAGIFLLIFSATVVTLVYEYRFRRRPRPEGEMLLSESERSQ